ncbi:MAG: cell division protein SepF [Clostridia bacterium]|nr:cell division protein SepF [Clostridia bacterium]
MSFWDYLTAGMGLVEKTPSVRQSRPPINKTSMLNHSLDERKITICEPVEFTDIVDFVKNLRRGVPVIVNFRSINHDCAERGLDFVCGAVCALGGKLERIGDGIYFYAPVNIAVESKNRSKGRKNAN